MEVKHSTAKVKAAPRKRAFPNTWLIIAVMIAIIAILSWIIPSGTYDYEKIDVNGTMRSVAIDGTYHTIDKSETKPTGFLGAFSALYEGCVSAADIVFVVMCCAGTFGIMVKTGAFHAGIGAVLRKVGKNAVIVVPILMVLFGLGGSLFGMISEFYGFYPLIVGLGVAMGYDAMFGFAIVALGSLIGFMSATLNPYTVAIQQSIAGVQLYSGTTYRWICFVVFMGVSAVYLLRYGKKVAKDPSRSLVAGRPCIHSFRVEDLNEYPFSWRTGLILVDLLVTMVILMYGLMNLGWGYSQLCGLFLIMSMVGAAIMGWGPNKYIAEFVDCVKNVIWGALLAGLAKGIMVVMNNAQIIDTIIYALSNLLRGAPEWLSAQLMLLVQTLINFPINSGSGQAVVTMPIMAPLGDALGISRQVACLACQFGDGLSNLLWPTGSIVIICGLADIPYEKWLKWFMPLFGILYVIQMVMLQIAVLIGYV